MGVQTDIYLYESSRAPKPKEAKYYYKVTCKGQYRWGVGRLPEGENRSISAPGPPCNRDRTYRLWVSCHLP